jgi:hypothetical protein
MVLPDTARPEPEARRNRSPEAHIDGIGARENDEQVRESGRFICRQRPDTLPYYLFTPKADGFAARLFQPTVF